MASMETLSSMKKLPNLQTRVHPQSRMSKPEDLNIMGSATSLGGGRIDFIPMTPMGGAGVLSVNRAKTDLPPLQRGSSHRIYSAYQSEDALLEKIKQPKFKRGPDDDELRQFGFSQIEAVVKDKVISGYHGLKQLFKANDPTGQGKVSREALQKILYTLVGYIPTDHFSNLMRRINLSEKQTISFDKFVGCFHDIGSTDTQWIAPVSRLGPSTPTEKRRPIICMRASTGTNLFAQPQGVSHTYALVIMREAARKNNGAEIVKLLPESCLQPDGVILKPQLMTIMEHFNLPVLTQDFEKLWQRFDLTNSGTIYTKAFLKSLGIRLEKPGPKLPIGQNLMPSNDMPTTPENEIVKPAEPVEDEPDVPRKRIIKPLRAVRPQLDSVLDSLFYLFEETHNSVLKTFKQFDVTGDGSINKIDFRQVMNMFGFPIGAIQFENFLSRCGLRVLKGLVNYVEFLTRFWSRADNSMINRIVSNTFHKFQQDLGPIGSEVGAEELEARLIDFFHADFFRLLSMFRSCDKHSIGVITQHEFRTCIERVLGWQMSQAQWATLINQETRLESDGLVNYPAFLEQFNAQPGAWNSRMVHGHPLTKITQSFTPPCSREAPTKSIGRMKMADISQELDSLHEQQKEKRVQRKLITKPDAESQKPEPIQPVQAREIPKVKNESRDAGADLLQQEDPTNPKTEPEQQYNGRKIEELKEILAKLLHDHFPHFDKHYKDIDRKYMGRINIQQFGEILFKCGVSMTDAELQCLWETFDRSVDGMCSYRKILHTFLKEMQPAKTLPQAVAEVAKVQGASMNRDVPPLPVNKTPLAAVSKIDTQNMLNCMRHKVQECWQELKAAFKACDPSGTGFIPSSLFQLTLERLGLQIPDTSMELLVNSYSSEKGLCYLSFMKYFTKQPSEESTSKDRHTDDSPKRVSKQHIEVQIIKEWKNLRRMFKKSDLKNEGHVGISDFTRILRSCGINASDEQLFQIACNLDPELGAHVCYEEFLSCAMHGRLFK